MPPRYSLTCLAIAAALLPLKAPGGALATGAEIVVAQACATAIAVPTVAQPRQLRHDGITLANWNIKKSSEDGWRNDLSALSEEADLVLLQEATLERKVRNGMIAGHYGTFAAGYSTNNLTSGVLTLSRVPPLASCALEHREPWLGTPKATAITLYPLDNGSTLLVVNLHGVNFSFSASPLQQQLTDISDHVARHRGPAVVAGDFNTWSDARIEELAVIQRENGLEKVAFAEDHRVRVFDNPLDHILVRGLAVTASQTLETSSSDHNGLLVKLSTAGGAPPAEQPAPASATIAP